MITASVMKELMPRALIYLNSEDICTYSICMTYIFDLHSEVFFEINFQGKVLDKEGKVLGTR